MVDIITGIFLMSLSCMALFFIMRDKLLFGNMLIDNRFIEWLFAFLAGFGLVHSISILIRGV